MSQGKACQILGRDIAANLVKLAKKWSRIKTLDKYLHRLEEYKTDQAEKLLKAKKEAAYEALCDQIECIMIIAENLPSGAKRSDLESKINSLFTNEDGELKPVITLMSCHKSKGLEAHRVFLLGREKYMPSPMETKAWQRKQEKHLLYVAGTRAKHTIVDVAV